MSVAHSARAAGLLLELVGDCIDVIGPVDVVEAWIGHLRANKPEIVRELRYPRDNVHRCWRVILSDGAAAAISAALVNETEMLTTARKAFGLNRVVRVEPLGQSVIAGAPQEVGVRHDNRE